MLVLLTMVAALAGEPYELRVASEVYRQGDDRTATKMEAWLTAHPEVLGPCRDRGLDADEPAIRYAAVRVWMRADGSVRKVTLLVSSESATADACVIEGVSAARIEPPPMFNDQLRVNITWAKPAEEPRPEEAAMPEAVDAPPAPDAGDETPEPPAEDESMPPTEPRPAD